LVFANYCLIGTVWMLPNSSNLNSNQTSAVGSVDLANATAETFVQNADNAPIKNVVKCFLCHNPTSYSFQPPPPAKLANRLVALSHVLAIGLPTRCPNSISGKLLLRPLLPPNSGRARTCGRCVPGIVPGCHATSALSGSSNRWIKASRFAMMRVSVSRNRVHAAAFRPHH
jgi:hypothetical protein